jgi:two-component system nitrate/nitrite response regulator NarL
VDLGVFVVGNDPLARGGIALLLSGHEGLSVLGQAAAGDDWAVEVRAAGAHAVVLDCDELDEGSRERLKAAPVPVVALVADARTASSALGSGARGALARDADGDQLIAALEAVLHSLVVTEQRFSSEWTRDRPPMQTAEALTPREHDVLQLLAQGLPNKVIAQRLAISDHTAKFHVNAILAKLGAESRTEAVVLASRLGLVVL